jgi:hypothetical protein
MAIGARVPGSLIITIDRGVPLCGSENGGVVEGQQIEPSMDRIGNRPDKADSFIKPLSGQ